MSDSEPEEENYCFLGKPLEPYDEDAFPKKKPISVEDQIATDAQGRRRFHGAFTGGFSAGFYNTVGSLEGWTPAEFKSTRQDKAPSKAQKPEDFMDDEDIGEFGIAPQTVKATSDYSTSKKRRRQVFSDGPIPGEPVLHSLLTSGNETIGYMLLKNMGLKKKAAEEEETAGERVYGCEMPRNYEISRDIDFNQYTIPDIYQEFLQKPKANTFGLGYEGLDKSHINLFKTSNLVIREQNKKKVSISGQAFGVGAFEDEDEDIYVRDDMNKYDFELTSESANKKTSGSSETRIFDDFVMAKLILGPRQNFPPPTIPHSFTGKHKVKKSRFEPLPAEITESEKIPERKDMNPEIRARYLGEETTPLTNLTEETVEKTKTEKTPVKTETSFDLFTSSGLVFDRFVSASQPEDVSDILQQVKPSETTHGSQEMRDAARMKMFGPLTRITIDWPPCSLLCKRFNVPEPHFDELNASRSRKRTKNLIFEYEKFSDVPVDLKPGLSIRESSNEISEEINSTSQVPDETNSATTKEPDTINQVENNDKAKEEKQEESPKDITDKIDIDKNIDLFKAVFLSSSDESENEEDTTEKEKEKEEKQEEMRSSVLSDNLLPKIKPIKEGILSNMDFSIFEKQDPVEIETGKLNSDDVGDERSYGPSLPAEKLPTSIQNIPSLSSQRKDYDEDEWVEKSEKEKKHKSAHKKKHKNKKSSHKKKHKHSRDKD